MRLFMLEDDGPHKAGQPYDFHNELEAQALIDDGKAYGPVTVEDVAELRAAAAGKKKAKPPAPKPEPPRE